MLSKPAKLRRHYGGPVSGEFYWPRPDVTRPVFDALLASESVRMFGLRRTGKSSVLLEVMRGLTAAGRKPVYVDVQGYDRADILVAALFQAMPNTAPATQITTTFLAKANKAIGLWQRLTGRTAGEAASPRAVLHQVELMRGDISALLAEQRGTIVLLVDELPYLLNNMLAEGLKTSEVNGFLATLRSWRQDGHLPMLLCGSMGLSWLVRERGIAREHFNDLISSPAPPPLEDADARDMLRALARGEGCEWMDDFMITTILQESAATYPSFLQFAFGRVKGHGAKSVDDIRRIFSDHIRPSLDEDFYAQFDSRISRYDASARATTREVIRSVDGANMPVSLTSVRGTVAAITDDLITSLVEDGFLKLDTKAGTLSFTSPLVRTWWHSKPYRR